MSSSCHLQHRSHGALRALFIVTAEDVEHAFGHEIPREAVAVGNPSARQLRAAFGELVPQVVELGLRFAAHEERDLALREGVAGHLRIARGRINRHELLTVELELEGHHRTLRPGSGLAVAFHVGNLRILEDGDVEIDRFFCLSVNQRNGVMLGIGHLSLLR